MSVGKGGDSEIQSLVSEVSIMPSSRSHSSFLVHTIPIQDNIGNDQFLAKQCEDYVNMKWEISHKSMYLKGVFCFSILLSRGTKYSCMPCVMETRHSWQPPVHCAPEGGFTTKPSLSAAVSSRWSKQRIASLSGSS